MLEPLAFGLGAVAVIVSLQVVADKTGLPAAALLTVGGLVYGLLPGPTVTLNPHVLLTFVIPPLIYSAALDSSLLAVRENLRVIVSLSIGLVLATSVAVGAGLDQFVPGAGLAAGVALGAAVAPTDPVAALAVGGRAGLPARMVTIIEGEGLLNDATALTTLTIAVTAAVSGGFSAGGAVVRFVLAAAGGLLAGLVVAVTVRVARSAVRDPVLVNCISLATPFAAYLLGEELHVSGVLAVAVAGLLVGHDTPRFTSGASRLQASAVWRLADFLLQGFVFLLIGQQIVPLARGLRSFPAGTIVAAVCVTLGVMLALRPAWLLATQSLPRALHTRLGDTGPRGGRRLTGRQTLVLSWAGTRGVISLAAIFTLPLAVSGGKPFPDRDLLLFCAYVVVLVTLIGQGVTFAPLVRALGLRADPADSAAVRSQARAASLNAARSRLNQLAADGDLPDQALAGLRASLDQSARRHRLIDQQHAAQDDGQLGPAGYEAALQARQEVIDAQREELLRWRDVGRLPDASLRILQRELDHEERILPPRDRG